MEMEQLINSDMKKAMVEKAKERLSAIRSIKAAIQLEKAKHGKEILTDEEIIKVILRLIRESNESATQYASAGRIDLVDNETFLISVFKTYLPEQLSENEITRKIKEFITETGASSIRDMGKVMALANKNFVGKADMKIVSEMVRNFLN